MGHKIKTYEDCFAKSQELTFKPQIEVKLPKGCKCSVDFMLLSFMLVSNPQLFWR
jgi:hypothetical protein